MQVQRTSESPIETTASAMAIGLFEDQVLTGLGKDIDDATGGALGRLVDHDEFTGKALQTVTLYAAQGLPTTRTVLVGLGKESDYDKATAFRAAGAASKAIAPKLQTKVAFYFPRPHQAFAVAGAMSGCVGQDLHRREPNLNPFVELIFGGEVDDEALQFGEALGAGILLTRELVNRPASEIYPESFVERASAVADAAGFHLEVWDLPRLINERCGALLGVAQGSTREPRLAIFEYRGGSSDQAPLALVGKGVTFDSGGLSLKPSDSMKDMKCDMAGAATVLGAMQTIARLQLPVNVIGLVGLVENMVSGSSFKLGDVLKARNGKTIEVLNTDAEGRLVLADVLDVAIERGASHIVDLATLTGACMVALGVDIAGLMSNDEALSQRVQEAAAAVGDQAWPLPMHSEFSEHIKSEVADIKNIGNGRWGGAITAAKFLEEFVGETPWVHLDIAGPSFYESPKPWCDAGASGVFVPTLVELARRWNNES